MYYISDSQPVIREEIFLYNFHCIIIIINIQYYLVYLILADFTNIDGMGFVIVAI